jgi:hypothetical protein
MEVSGHMENFFEQFLKMAVGQNILGDVLGFLIKLSML